METKDRMTEINISGMHVLACVQSLEFIIKDLAEMETQACQVSDGYYCGLTNIVEQMTRKIGEEVKVIMELSE